MRGFTLIEIMVTSVVLAILIVGLFLVLSLGQRSWLTADTGIQLRQDISRALMVMSQELKQTSASKINIALNGSASSIRFKLPQDTNGDGSIVDSTGNIEWSGYITYSLNASNQVVRSVDGGTTSIIANNISALTFTRVLSEVIQIDIAASKAADTGKTIEDSDQIILKLRN